MVGCSSDSGGGGARAAPAARAAGAVAEAAAAPGHAPAALAARTGGSSGGTTGGTGTGGSTGGTGGSTGGTGTGGTGTGGTGTGGTSRRRWRRGRGLRRGQDHAQHGDHRQLRRDEAGPGMARGPRGQQRRHRADAHGFAGGHGHGQGHPGARARWPCGRRSAARAWTPRPTRASSSRSAARSTNLELRVPTPATYPVADGGICTDDAKCGYSHYRKVIPQADRRPPAAWSRCRSAS